MLNFSQRRIENPVKRLFDNSDSSLDSVKYRNLTKFPEVKIFVKRYSFSRVSGNSPETLQKLRQNFYTRKLGEFTVFYGVLEILEFQKSSSRSRCHALISYLII